MDQKRATEKQLNTPKIKVNYQDWGDLEGKQGSPVIALHGLASTSHWYNLLLPYLTNKYWCIAPDQRGHGKTDHPIYGYSWSDVASDVTYIMDKLNIAKASIIGHSWGAHVALGLAALFPSRVSSLVMIDGGFLDFSIRPGTTWEWFKERLKPRDVSGTKGEYIARMQKQLENCWSNQLETIIMSMVNHLPDDTVEDILNPVSHSQILEAMWNYPPSSMFNLIQCPTLIVAALPKEPRNPSFTRLRFDMVSKAKESISDCKVVWIKDTIHDIGFHKPMELSEEIKLFLSEL